MWKRHSPPPTTSQSVSINCTLFPMRLWLNFIVHTGLQLFWSFNFFYLSRNNITTNSDSKNQYKQQWRRIFQLYQPQIEPISRFLRVPLSLSASYGLQIPVARPRSCRLRFTISYSEIATFEIIAIAFARASSQISYAISVSRSPSQWQISQREQE